MKLAIILVSYNTRYLLRNCLRSIFASALPTDLALEVLVIDNASHDGSAEMVEADFAQVVLIRSEENIGFTRANDMGLRTLGFIGGKSPRLPDYVLLLNPDTELAPDALEQMVDFLARTPKAGVVGAQLRYGSGDFQHGAFRFPTLAQVTLDLFPLAEIPLLRRLHPLLHDSAFNGRYSQQQWRGEQPFSVDFVLGAAMMVRGAAIQQTGGLDEGFFMYCEEMDWCMRIRQAGWEIYAVPSAHVTHYEGQSSRQIRWQSFAWLWQSRFRFYEKHRAHYGTMNLLALRLLVRLGMGWQQRRAWRRFAGGQTDGRALAEELAARRTIAAL